MTNDNDNKCPVCSTEILKFDKWSGKPTYKYCHPLKRIKISGFWWWKKYCLDEGVHNHVLCTTCKIQWLEAIEGDLNYEIKESCSEIK